MNQNPTPPPVRTALRNLIIVLVIAVVAAIYSYGWTVTDIDLNKPQEPTRLSSVSNAMRELLSPRIFQQERDITTLTAPFVMTCPEDGVAPVEPPTDGSAYFTIEPACGVVGDVVTVTAHNFAPLAAAQIRWAPPTGQTRPRTVIGMDREQFEINPDGTFTGEIEVPRVPAQEGDVHQIEFLQSIPVGPVQFSDNTTEVIRRMAETIFMALVATTLAIPISVVLSFFAAHNLMKPIRMPTGNLMVFIVALPIGWMLGSAFLGFVGRFGVNLGQGEFSNLFNASATLPIMMLGATVATSGLKLKPDDPLVQIRAVAGQILVAVLIVFIFGLLGGLGIVGGNTLSNIAESLRPEIIESPVQWLQNAFADGIHGFGYLLSVIGGIIDLTIVMIAGVVGAFTSSSVLTRITKEAMRQMPDVMSHVVGGVLGFFTGAVIMYVVATISSMATLLTLLTPLAAALIAGKIVNTVYRNQIIEKRQFKRVYTQDKIATFALSLLVFGAVFALTVAYLGIGRMLIDGSLPAATTTRVLGFEISYFVWNAVQVGAVLGLVWGALAGTRTPFAIGDLLYNITRNILNATRSIEPLIMALIFVIWVGIGPFAGVLALMLHSIASLGKLYSEQIETIDQGPIEALQSTGANHLQTIIYAVVPQIIPPYIAYTMYRWDINVRMSTIIGFVGGGGIGLLLNQQINLLRYRDAGVAVLSIAIVVSILDYASASIRERVI